MEAGMRDARAGIADGSIKLPDSSKTVKPNPLQTAAMADGGMVTPGGGMSYPGGSAPGTGPIGTPSNPFPGSGGLGGLGGPARTNGMGGWATPGGGGPNPPTGTPGNPFPGNGNGNGWSHNWPSWQPGQGGQNWPNGSGFMDQLKQHMADWRNDHPMGGWRDRDNDGDRGMGGFGRRNGAVGPPDRDDYPRPGMNGGGGPNPPPFTTGGPGPLPPPPTGGPGPLPPPRVGGQMPTTGGPLPPYRLGGQVGY